MIPTLSKDNSCIAEWCDKVPATVWTNRGSFYLMTCSSSTDGVGAFFLEGKGTGVGPRAMPPCQEHTGNCCSPGKPVTAVTDDRKAVESKVLAWFGLTYNRTLVGAHKKRDRRMRPRSETIPTDALLSHLLFRPAGGRAPAFRSRDHPSHQAPSRIVESGVNPKPLIRTVGRISWPVQKEGNLAEDDQLRASQALAVQREIDPCACADCLREKRYCR